MSKQRKREKSYLADMPGTSEVIKAFKKNSSGNLVQAVIEQPTACRGQQHIIQQKGKTNFSSANNKLITNVGRIKYPLVLSPS